WRTESFAFVRGIWILEIHFHSCALSVHASVESLDGRSGLCGIDWRSSGFAWLVHAAWCFPDRVRDGYRDLWSVVAEVFCTGRNGVSDRIPGNCPGFAYYGRRTSIGRSANRRE